MCKKLTISLIFILLKVFEISATVTIHCNYDTNYNPPSCRFYNVSQVMSVDEDVVIYGQPPSYVDYAVQSAFTFPTGTILDYIPRKIFNIFPNLQGIQIDNMLNNIVSNNIINCNQLNAIYLSNNNFNTLPDNFADQCPEIRELYFSFNTMLTFLHENALFGLTKLMKLMINRSRVRCIPPSFFVNKPILESISFSGNEITALDPITFVNLPNLKAVDFSNNQIAYIPKFDLSGTGSSETLTFNFNSNPIMAMDPTFFAYFFAIQSNWLMLMFSYPDQTQTDQVLTCSAQGSTAITDVYLSNWALSNPTFQLCYDNWTPSLIQPIVCNSIVTTSTTISSTDTTTTTSSSSTIAPAPCPNDKIVRCYLDYLDRYSCVVKGVEGSLSSITVGQHYSTPDYTYTDNDVERFYFMESQLGRVPSILFNKFPNLNYLYIRSTSLGVINDHTFNECGNLKFLDASYNDIIHIDESSLRNCTKLEVIDLTGNPLDYLSTQLYVYDPTVRNIHFHRNPDFVLD